jgi:hypothetical protein
MLNKGYLWTLTLIPPPGFRWFVADQSIGPKKQSGSSARTNGISVAASFF